MERSPRPREPSSRPLTLGSRLESLPFRAEMRRWRGVRTNPGSPYPGAHVLLRRARDLQAVSCYRLRLAGEPRRVPVRGHPEDEGVTVILTKADADETGLAYDYVAARTRCGSAPRSPTSA